MEIIIRHNGVYLKNANLNKGFSELMVDLTVDNYSRVKVKTKSNLSFYTDLVNFPYEILVAMSEARATSSKYVPLVTFFLGWSSGEGFLPLSSIHSI